MAAAVILDPARPIDGLADSKALTAPVREQLAMRIRNDALAFAVGIAEAQEIDRINILQATFRAMLRALDSLPLRPHWVQIDGNCVPPLGELSFVLQGEAIVQGDVHCAAISAASILAKTTRDALMVRFGNAFPSFTFATHKGYPTPAHLRELQQYGPTPLHRHSFAPVKSLLEPTRMPD